MSETARKLFGEAGVAADLVDAWSEAHPGEAGNYTKDKARYSAYWQLGERLRQALPAHPAHGSPAWLAREWVVREARHCREEFLAAHASDVYDELTNDRAEYVRLEDLVFKAAQAVPGLCPTREQVAAEDTLDHKDKYGAEVDQGIFLAHVLADRIRGSHLCHAMLLPLPQSLELARKFDKDGVLEIGHAHLERRGKAVLFTGSNPRFLNAEDMTTLTEYELATDVALLDTHSELVVMRGGVVENPKYAGRRLYGAGINLTRIYKGEIAYEFYMRRDLGYLHKLYRGLASPGPLPDDVDGRTREKPFIAVVEGFAIGGHCQLLLVSDYVLAASDAYMTLPARKEGIIPGFANLRLPRFVGDRITRQAIMYERRLDCDTPEGRMICDEIVAPEAMDEAIDRVVEGLTSAGQVSAVGNRRAIRVGQEPFDLFRQYASAYAREQAYCHFSPALIANLERNWDAKNRKV